MTKKEAIETIKANWPSENYTMLREALDMAIDALNEETNFSCTYYKENNKEPCCTHDCCGCVWYA